MKPNVFSILQKKFPEKEYVIMKEVSDASGYDRSRSADYVVVNLWPSRGLAINGIELKSYRGDWLNELKNPKKAENIFKYCDYWWLLTTDDTLAKIDEIPINWGWMAIKNDKIVVKKQAPKLTPVALSKSFSICMLRRAADKTDYVHVENIQNRIDSEKANAVSQIESANRSKLNRVNELQKIITDFEDASGLKLDNRYSFMGDLKKLGTAVKILLEGGTESLLEKLKMFKNGNDKVNESLSKAIEELEGIKTNTQP